MLNKSINKITNVKFLFNHKVTKLHKGTMKAKKNSKYSGRMSGKLSADGVIFCSDYRQT